MTPDLSREIRVRATDTEIRVRAPGDADRLKSLGGQFDPERFEWILPNTAEVALAVGRHFQQWTADKSFVRLLVRAGIDEVLEKRGFAKTEAFDGIQIRTKPWAHQERAFDFAKDKPASMLALDMGCGKSLVALMLAHVWGCERILIACPLSVVGVWPRELDRHSLRSWLVARCDKGSVAAKQDHAGFIVETAGAKRLPCAVVVNHESLWRDPFGKWASSVPWDLVIVDESHRAKAPGGKLSRYLGRLALQVPRRLALTGTPLPHSPLDAYAQFRFLDRTVFGQSFTHFRNRYAVMGGYGGHEIKGFQRMDEFHKLFERHAYQVRKEEALELPEEVDAERRCELEPKARKVYDSLAKDFWAEVEAGEITAVNALTRLLRLQQVTSGWVPTVDADDPQAEPRGELISEAKRKLLADVLEDFGGKDPAVAFARFHQDLDVIREIGEKRGLRVGEVSGRLKDGLTDEATMREDIDLLAVQIQSGGVGIDLTRASTAIFYSLGFSLADYLQARARLHRPGQTDRVTFLHLLVEGTIDERVLAALRRREEVIDSILKGRVEAEEVE